MRRQGQIMQMPDYMRNQPRHGYYQLPRSLTDSSEEVIETYSTDDVNGDLLEVRTTMTTSDVFVSFRLIPFDTTCDDQS